MTHQHYKLRPPFSRVPTFAQSGPAGPSGAVDIKDSVIFKKGQKYEFVKSDMALPDGLNWIAGTQIIRNVHEIHAFGRNFQNLTFFEHEGSYSYEARHWKAVYELANPQGG
jgi:hypothetical protein